ncbi:hypothetical protein ACGH2B_15105 [Streptomyces sp. BBFR2]|uniref:DUF7224 domain-containing protein n=1 Tax=Streptomyces sp. BBFR2 TaxID=3372854 RepID=UPI0037D9ED33
MRLLLRFRSSSAAWGALFAIPLTSFYFFVTVLPVVDDGLHYAPRAVSLSLTPMYAFAYAMASCLGAWESGRLKEYGVWDLAPARSRYRVAAEVLLPVVCAASLTLVLPAALALVAAGAAPTAGSLGPLLMAVVLCGAHAVIGFGAGQRVPRFIAAPLLAVAVWILVAFSHTATAYWPRHVAGQFPGDLMFGEEATWLSLAPPLLFTGGIGLAVATLWLPVRRGLLRLVPAAALAVVPAAGALHLVGDWDHNPPLATGRGAMRCAGTAPEVCMPRERSEHLEAVRRAAVSVLADFAAAGVHRSPQRITDSINHGRFAGHSRPGEWQLPLSAAAATGQARALLTDAAVGLGCPRPSPVLATALSSWAARTTGEESALRHRQAEERDPDARGRRKAAEALLRRVYREPAAEQARWFEESRRQACHGGG